MECSTIGANRLSPNGPTVETIPVLAARALGDRARLLGLMYVNRVHPTVLHEDSLLISGDFNQLVYSIRADITYKLLPEATIHDPVTGDVLYTLPQQDMVALRATMRPGWQSRSISAARCAGLSKRRAISSTDSTRRARPGMVFGRSRKALCGCANWPFRRRTGP